MYSVPEYGQMITDTGRLEAYACALEQLIRPSSVVLDLGCGLGVFAILACRLGAARVFAIEPDNVIVLAKEIAAANGVEDRIEFFPQYSTKVTFFHARLTSLFPICAASCRSSSITSLPLPTLVRDTLLRMAC